MKSIFKEGKKPEKWKKRREIQMLNDFKKKVYKPPEINAEIIHNITNGQIKEISE